MDGRLLGLCIVIFALAIVETSAQNFYPMRYGKRKGQATDGRWSGGSQYERRSELFGKPFFGSRYGKRSPNTTPPESLTQSSIPSAGDRSGRSSTMISPDRSFFGPRFGKRTHRSSTNSGEQLRSGDDDDVLLCQYTGFRHLYHCRGDAESDQPQVKVL